MESELFQHPHPAFLTGTAAEIMRRRHAAWMLRTLARHDQEAFMEWMREDNGAQHAAGGDLRAQQCKIGLRDSLDALDAQ